MSDTPVPRSLNVEELIPPLLLPLGFVVPPKGEKNALGITFILMMV